MGYRLAMAAGITPVEMSDRARIVLVRMGAAARDTPSKKEPAAEYWGGWEYLAIPWRKLGDNGQRSVVQRAINELVTLGLIKPLGAAHKGQRQRYAITLDY